MYPALRYHARITPTPEAMPAYTAPTGRKRGFTLIELMVTLAILAILAVMVNHVAEIMARREKEQQLYAALRAMRGAIDSYKRAYDGGHIKQELGATGYPKDLQSLTVGIEDELDPQRVKIYFLDRIPPDPMQRGSESNPAQSWDTRAYISDPDSPQPGPDVYDVHSKSTAMGLNNAPYSKW